MTTPANIPISVLLIDDQIIVAEALRRILEDQKDIEFHYCNNPENAISMAADVKPTVILQDLVMPEMDGLLLLRYFRANPATSDVPMIVLSIKEDPEVKASAFALGANDYLVKLPDKVELVARIRHHSAAYTRLLERNQAYEELAAGKKHLQSELNEAAAYVRALLPDPMENSIHIDWRYIPSSSLGGDAFDYAWLDEDHLSIYLLDVCGHGVGAALLSITVMNELRAKKLQVDYYDPKAVLEALNTAYPMEKHNNMFFTIWYGVYNKKEKRLLYSSGGHPPAVAFCGNSPDALQAIELKTPGLVIGAMPDVQYQNAALHLKKINKIYIFSDGIYELVKPDGTMLKLDEFTKILADSKRYDKDALSQILNYVKSLNVESEFSDDVTILEVIL